MDLLGEIFDTLSSRSSHDRGVLYGTRSLDLFGPDSNDFITKHSLTNPSEESLCISGSGSLHSWHQETSEDLSDLTEDWGQLNLDKTEEREIEETPMMLCENQQQNILQQDKATSELNDRQVEERLFQETDADVEIVDNTKSENPHLAEKDRIGCKDEFRQTSEDPITAPPQDLIRNQECGQTGLDPSPVSSHLSVPVTPEQTQPRSSRTTPPPPKVLSAAARFQSHTTVHGPDLKSRLKSLAEGGGSLCSSEGESELTSGEKEPSPVKVSELKKRFET